MTHKGLTLRKSRAKYVLMKKKLSFLVTLLATYMIASTALAGLQDIEIKDIDGKATSLKQFSGKTVLLVNVASQCGYTPQYKGLEAVYRQYKDRGFVVVGVPSNDFGGQEPGSATEIKDFCSSKYGVTFPMMEKVKVKGADKHPLYQALTGEGSPYPGEVKWNFGKFLIGPDGKLLARFDSGVKPESEELISAIEKSLKK